MDLLQNPFHVLSASPRDNRGRIMELADERSRRTQGYEDKGEADHEEQGVGQDLYRGFLVGFLFSHLAQRYARDEAQIRRNQRQDARRKEREQPGRECCEQRSIFHESGLPVSMNVYVPSTHNIAVFYR